MASKKLEALLVESIKNLLANNELGTINEEAEVSHTTQFQWEDILRDFALKIKDLTFFDSINAAFYKIHSYKWLEDDKFEYAFIDELESQGIPHEEIEKAIEALESVRKEYIGKNNNENAVGWGNVEDAIKVSKEFDEEGDHKFNFKKDTMSGKNEPFQGAEPKNVRPVKNEA